MIPALDLGALSALAQVILIDLVLAGDNAIAVALAAAGLPLHQRRRVIVTGIALAAVLRVLFALVTVQLLKITGLLLVGGVLLLWIAWKLAVEIRQQHAPAPDVGEDLAAEDRMRQRPPGKTVRQAMTQILIADFSMSLDNVLGVAAVAREHPVVLVIGLALSVAFMGFAAAIIARLLERHRWIAWAGVVLIFWVGIVMVYEGGRKSSRSSAPDTGSRPTERIGVPESGVPARRKIRLHRPRSPGRSSPSPAARGHPAEAPCR